MLLFVPGATSGEHFPDARGCSFTSEEELVVVYADQSLIVWSLKDIAQVGDCWVLCLILLLSTLCNKSILLACLPACSVSNDDVVCLLVRVNTTAASPDHLCPQLVVTQQLHLGHLSSRQRRCLQQPAAERALPLCNMCG